MARVGLTAMVKHDDHGIIMVIHTRQGMIMLKSCHAYHEKWNDNGIAVMEKSMIMPW